MFSNKTLSVKSSLTSQDNEDAIRNEDRDSVDSEEEQFIQTHKIIDLPLPLRHPLTAKYKRTFAFRTFRERTPNMLLEMIETLKTRECRLAEQFGDYVHHDLHCVIWSLQILRDEILQNKPFKLFYDKKPDSSMWNSLIKVLVVREKNRWFSSDWLFAECYLYRRILGAFRRTKTLKDFDYFGQQKICATRNIIYLLRRVLAATRNLRRSKKNLQLILKLSLWGNRCDLAITKELPSEDMVDLIEIYDRHLIVDQSENVWQLLAHVVEPGIIDIVLDNAGYELFADLLLGEYLLNTGLATKVRYHVKTAPWFISDVTANDFNWMLRFLRRSEILEMRAFGRSLHRLRCNKYLELYEECSFWVSPHGFCHLRESIPSLYVQFSFAQLVIFKGDLNYRKLIDDVNWDPTTPFDKCLGGFMPTNVCALRCIKCDVFCGMPLCVVEWLTEDNSEWMCTGEKAVIQLAIKPRP